MGKMLKIELLDNVYNEMKTKNVSDAVHNTREKIYKKFGEQRMNLSAYMVYCNPFRFI